MKSLKSVFLSMVMLCVTCLLAAAQDASPKASPARINSTLLAATGAYEDAVGPALAKNDKAVIELLKKADKEAGDVKKSLPAGAAAEFTALLQGLHKSAEAKDHLSVARDCMVVFRLLVENLKASALKIPKEVSLLDYAGYQMEVLAADKPDWNAISQLASDAESWWKAIHKSKVTDKDLAAVMSSTIAGMKQGAEEKNLAMVKFAARIDLDMVDLLEAHFTSKK